MKKLSKKMLSFLLASVLIIQSIGLIPAHAEEVDFSGTPPGVEDFVDTEESPPLEDGDEIETPSPEGDDGTPISPEEGDEGILPKDEEADLGGIMAAMGAPAPYNLSQEYTAGTDFEIEVTIKVNDQKIEPDQTPPPLINDEDKIEFKVDFKDGDYVFLPGDKAIIPLPDVFDLSHESFTSYVLAGVWEVDGISDIAGNKSITLKAMDYIDTDAFFLGWANLSIETTSIENLIEILFPISATETLTYKIKVKPIEINSSIQKKAIGSPDKNEKTLKWESTINLFKETLTTAKFKDVMDPGLEPDISTIKIIKADVTNGGDISPSSPEVQLVKDTDYTITTDSSKPNEFEIDFLNPIGEAYIISYETKIVSRNNGGSTTYNNTASLSADELLEAEASGTQTVVSDATLDKQGSAEFNDNKIAWTITLNKAQDPLTNVNITDVLPSDVTLDLSSFKFYTFTAVDGSGTPTGKVEVAEGDKPTVTQTTIDGKSAFSIGLGDFSNGYIIEYETSIDSASTGWSMNSQPTSYVGSTKLFTNTVTMESDEYSGDDKLTSNANVTVSKGINLKKNGVVYNRDYTGQTKGDYTWNIKVNTAGETMNSGGKIIDTLPDGLGLPSITSPLGYKIYKLDLDKDGELVSNGKTEITEDHSNPFDVTTDEGEAQLIFTLNQDTSDAYEIEYTTPVTDSTKGIYRNSVEGTGIGPGGSYTDYDQPGTLPTNTITKNNLGINYHKNTMKWKITLDFRGVVVNDLEIDDTFTNGGLSLEDITSENFKVYKYSASGSSNRSEVPFDNVIDSIDKNSVTSDFQIIFKDGLHGLYEIEYETMYDRESHTNENEKSQYKNKIDFDNDDVVGTTSDSVQSIGQKGALNGWKYGSRQGNTNKIKWTVTLNYMAEPMTNLQLIEENFKVAGYRLKPDSLKVYEINLKNEFNASINNNNNNNHIASSSEKLVILDGSNVTYLADGDGFTLTLGNTSSPYRVEYETEWFGFAKQTYTNTAVVKDGDDVNTTLTASVTFNDWNEYLKKNKVTKGAKIEWTVNINKALSEILNATIVDSLSAGHIYDLDTVKIIDVTESPNITLAKGTDYTVELISNSDGTQSLQIIFADTIRHEYKLTYTTEVTRIGEGEIYNTVNLSGDGVDKKIEKEETQIPNYDSGINAGGSSASKMIRVKKIDAGTGEPIEGAVFELVDEDGNPAKHRNNQLVANQTTNPEGIVQFENLGRKIFKVKEVSPATGYILPENIADSTRVFDLIENKLEGDFVKVLYTEADATGANTAIENTRDPDSKEILLKKVGSDDLTKGLEGAVFELFDSEGSSLGTKTSGSDGIVKFLVTKNDTYTIREISAPEGYKKATGDVTVTVVASAKTEYNDYVTSPIENEKQVERSLQLKKVGSNNLAKGLQGAQFKLTGLDSNGFAVSKTATSDADGLVVFETLYQGSYSIEEITAPAGYTKSNKIITVEITEDDITLDDGIEVEKGDTVVYRVKADVVNTYIPPSGGGGGGPTPKDPEEEPKEEPKEEPELPETPGEEPEVPGEEETPEEVITPEPTPIVIPPNPTPHIPRVIEIDGVLIDIDDESIPFADRLRAYEEWILINPDSVPLLGGVPKTGIGYQPIKITISDRMVETILPDSVTMNRKDKKKRNKK